VDACKPLMRGGTGGVDAVARAGTRQGLTLVHFQLNLSAFCVTGGAVRVCFGGVEGVVGGSKGV
jgi:hypothetical protein